MYICMLGQLPHGIRDGHIARRARNYDEIEREILWTRLSQRYKLPKKDYVFLYELQQLDHGRRWAPSIDQARWDSAISMCKRMHIPLDQRQHALKNSNLLDARLQFEKLSWYLQSSGRQPLIKVRRGTYHTLVYIVYCCMVADPQNFTIWRVGSVGIQERDKRLTREELANMPYYYKMMIWKSQMADDLERLGLRFCYETNYNKIYHLISSSLLLNKMQVLSVRYPDSSRDHRRLVEVDRHNLQIRLRSLRETAFVVARQENIQAVRDQSFETDFDGASWFALCFDPLFPYYVEPDFNDVTDAIFYWGHYVQFQHEFRELMARHREELDNAWEASAHVRPRRMRRMMSSSSSSSSEEENSSDDSSGNLGLL